MLSAFLPVGCGSLTAFLFELHVIGIGLLPGDLGAGPKLRETAMSAQGWFCLGRQAMEGVQPAACLQGSVDLTAVLITASCPVHSRLSKATIQAPISRHHVVNLLSRKSPAWV